MARDVSRMSEEAPSGCLEPLLRRAICRIHETFRCSLQSKFALLQGSTLLSKRGLRGSRRIYAVTISIAAPYSRWSLLSHAVGRFLQR